VKNCNWIAKKAARRCQLTGQDGTTASESCQEACDTCICTSNPDWRQLQYTGLLEDCDWVAMAPGLRCQAIGVDGTRAYESCVGACAQGHCTCRDSSSWRDNRRQKNCGWVGKRPGKRCDIVGLDGTRAEDSCLEACGRCSVSEAYESASCPTSGPAIEVRAENSIGYLQECEGDCDDNSDCIGDLVCFHRNAGDFSSVPGCQGGWRDGSRTDYCVNLDLPPINNVANPSAAGGECEGDCDVDSDCDGQLICFHRDRGDFLDVPGCADGESDGSRTDFCIDPDLPLVALVANIVANSLGYMQECEGDCDYDSNCIGDLVCFHRNAGDFSSVPGCQGGWRDGSRTDYCVDPDLPPINNVANPSAAGGECEGDCDVDSDCDGELICFHRDQGDFLAVPGCAGGEWDGSRTDFCIDPYLPVVSLFVNSSVPDLGLCEGDCDSDSDCAGGLVCFLRDQGDFSDVPGCSGGTSDGSRTDYCVDLSWRDCLPSIEIVAHSLLQGEGDECEGDCDIDSDCAGRLICFHRDQGDFSEVPGCQGGSNDGSRTDYCVDPSNI
jgi:hypothetical protein